MDANRDVDISHSAFRLTNSVQYRGHESEPGHAIVLEVIAKLCFKRINGRPILHLKITDPRRPFQPTSVADTDLRGHHLIEQTPASSPHFTQEAATLLADIAADHHMDAEVAGVMFGGAINNDEDFWDMMKPVIGRYLREHPQKFHAAREIYVVRFAVRGGWAVSLFIRRIMGGRYLSYIANPLIMYMPTA